MFPVAAVCGNTMIMKPVSKTEVKTKEIFLFDY
jgi:hypothetical protein